MNDDVQKVACRAIFMPSIRCGRQRLERLDGEGSHDGSCRVPFPTIEDEWADQ